MHEMRHHSLSLVDQGPYTFSECVQCVFGVQSLMPNCFLAHSVLGELALTYHLAKLFINRYVPSWLETGNVLLQNLFQVILLSFLCHHVQTTSSNWYYCAELSPLT